MNDVTIAFGGIKAVSGFTLDVGSRRVTSIIGPNGAGKSTLLNGISGFVPFHSGSISYQGVELARTASWKRAALGIGRTFQGLGLFDNLTVLENVMIGGHWRQHTNAFTGLLYWGWADRDNHRARSDSLELLDRLGLADVAQRTAGTLPLASQKSLAIARALAGRPSLLLLDEPAAGMSGEGIAAMARMIRDMVDERELTIILVEHHMKLVMAVSDAIAVMHQGQLLTTGTPEEIQRHPEVISVYLGTGVDPHRNIRDSQRP